MKEVGTYLAEYFGLNPVVTERVASKFEEVSLEKGAIFAQPGQPCMGLAFIQEGFFRIYTYTDKKEVTQWVSAPGELLTDLQSLVFEGPSRWYIEALTPARVALIPLAKYPTLAEVIPEWSVWEKKFMSKCFMMLEDRVFTFLAMNAEQRYDVLKTHRGDLFEHVSLGHIASMLGMTQETLSRIRSKR